MYDDVPISGDFQIRRSSQTPSVITAHLPLPTNDAGQEEEEVKFTKRYLRATWARIWCTMLGQNVFACFRDTRAGVIHPGARKTDTRASIGPTAA